MTQQFKNDIKTIIEVSIFLVFYCVINFIYSEYVWLPISLTLLWIATLFYNRYFKMRRPNTILFPTLNDGFLKTTPIAFGVLLLFFSVIGYFAFSFSFFYAMIGATAGVAVFSFGFSASPNGWASIENNSLKIYGIEGDIDIRQLREIMLKNDSVTLTNIYGEHKNINQLKLDTLISQSIQKFLQEKLNNRDIVIIDNVTNSI